MSYLRVDPTVVLEGKPSGGSLDKWELAFKEIFRRELILEAAFVLDFLTTCCLAM